MITEKMSKVKPAMKNRKKNDLTAVAAFERCDPLTMLSGIECIVRVMEDSELKSTYLESMQDVFEYISEMQGLTYPQALLLAIFVENTSDGSNVPLSSVARFLNVSNVRVMQFQEEIDDMVKRKFLRKVKRRFGNEHIGYMVPDDVIKAIKNNCRFEPKSLVAKNGIQFFQMVYDLTHLRKEEEIDTELLKDDFEQLLEENKSLWYVKQLERLKLPINAQLIVTQLARHLVLNQEEYITSDNLVFLFDDRHEAYAEVHPLEEGDHILMKKHIVEFGGRVEFINKTKYKLTEPAKAKLLKGFSLPKQTETEVNVRKADSIAEKSLFFNGEVGQQIETLSDLLTEEKLAAIQTRLKEHGRRTGVACLFYGAPGTGKTESVLQIARITGRDIMLVDMSEIKSKWVGESEQNIKAVFDNYRALCKASERTPILLFNEADAILGTRMGRAMHAVDKMNNAMQNIILQEMEMLDGIMIATTNLEKSLDSAFERRFLYKVRFVRPDVEQRAKIWKSMLTKLSDDEAAQLAATYDFSGGQIENIVRKCDVESILYGESSVNADKIQRFCQEESILKNEMAHIGFV